LRGVAFGVGAEIEHDRVVSPSAASAGSAGGSIPASSGGDKLAIAITRRCCRRTRRRRRGLLHHVDRDGPSTSPLARRIATLGFSLDPTTFGGVDDLGMRGQIGVALQPIGDLGSSDR